MNFGDRLRRARIAKGWTQERLGLDVGVTKSSVSAWENGHDVPSFHALKKIGETLGVSIDGLVYGSGGGTSEPVDNVRVDDHRAATPREYALLLRARSFSARRLDALLELLRLETDEGRS